MHLRLLLASLILSFFTCFAPDSVNGQDSTSHATLMKWEQEIRNFMLDRSHNFGGTYFNRGLFREHINEMSPEYNIDLMTYQFTIVDDYQWEQAERAYRLSVGSLNATKFAIENMIKADIAFGKHNEISIEGYHSENLRTNRFLFNLGYKRRIIGKHQVGFRHTLTKEKSDLDATLFYRYGNFSDGMLELDVTIMDWASNVVEGLAEGSRNKYNQRYEITHQYSNSPELLSLKFVSPQLGHFRAELMGGIQTYSRKRVEQHVDTLHYVDEEWAHYVGGLIEYARPNFTAGLTYQRTFSKLRRNPITASNYDLDFTNRQITNHFGFFALGRIKSFRLEQWAWLGHDIDWLQGEKVPGDLKPRGFERIPFDYLEEPISLKSRVYYDPVQSGLKTGLEFHAEYSRPQGEKANNGVRNFDFRRTYSIVKDYNSRLTYTIGYRFSPHFYLLGGFSYDLDGDKQSGRGVPKISGEPTWFDGGFGRFLISW